MASNCQNLSDNPDSLRSVGHQSDRGLGEEVPQRVQLIPVSATKVQAGKFSYQFKLFDTQNNHFITDKDLIIEHEMLLHLIIFDPALIEFQHLHALFKESLWTVDAELSVNGNFWVWVQGKLAFDETTFSSNGRLLVEGGTQEIKSVDLKDVRSGNDSNSIVTLNPESFQSNKIVTLVLKFSRLDGSKPQLSTYLGEKAHIVIVPSTGDALIHAHPILEDKDQLVLHVEFPKSGSYRIWVQFIDGGALKLVPLAVQVND